MKPSISIVGCGKVGTNLAMQLQRRGYPIFGISTRNQETLEEKAQLLNIENASTIPWEITSQAEVVFITTPDTVIEKTCSDIASSNGFLENAVVLHCSGALPSTLLAAAKKRNTAIGSLHPLQSVASVNAVRNPFENINAAIEGEPEALRMAEMICRDLGAKPITIATRGKNLYHASAVVASNYLVTLMALAFQLIGKAGIRSAEAYDVLSPLIKGTLTNIEKIGIPEALTGPIARGDAETVEKHLDDMAAFCPEMIPLYQALGRFTIEIAKAKGTLDERAAEKCLQVLDHHR